MVDPRFFAPADIAGAYQRGLQFHAQRQQFNEEKANKKRLRELLPVAMGRGGRSEEGAMSQDDAITQLYAVNPEVAMRLDEHQRKQAKEELADLSAAVRWADSPEKWQYVQQFYGQKGVDLSPYAFEQRERGLVALGQIGEFLEGGPKNNATALEREYEFLAQKDPALAEQYLRGRAEGSPIVNRNADGTITVYPRSMLGGGPAPASPSGPRRVASKAEYDALPAGSEYIAPDGSRRTKGGPTPQASGGFPSAGY